MLYSLVSDEDRGQVPWGKRVVAHDRVPSKILSKQKDKERHTEEAVEDTPCPGCALARVGRMVTSWALWCVCVCVCETTPGGRSHDGEMVRTKGPAELMKKRGTFREWQPETLGKERWGWSCVSLGQGEWWGLVLCGLCGMCGRGKSIVVKA